MATADTIQRYYQTLLFRTGSSAEVATWVGIVDQGGISLQQVQLGFINSAEALNNVSPIVEMYQDHLGRLPDQGGLAYWVSMFDTGAMTMAQIGMAIAGSAESQAFYGTIFDANYVTALYEKILGREPEAGVVSVWLARNAAGLTQPQIQEQFRMSAEAGGRAAPAVSNFLSAIAQSNPNAFTGSLYSLGRIMTLTTGQDYGAGFTGTSGNDTFQGVEDTSTGSPLPVWTTADAIDGGAGINTFNVIQTAAITSAPLNVSVSNIQIGNIVDASSVTINTTGWSGLTALNVTDTGATNLTASGTTAVAVNDSAGSVVVSGGLTQYISTNAGGVTLSGATGGIAVTATALGTNSVTIDGGTSVALNLLGEVYPSSGPVLNLGSTTAPTGPVFVNVSSDPTATTNRTLGTIVVKGGSVVTVNQNVLGAANHTFTAGTISIQGTAATTSVTTSSTPVAAVTANTSGVVANSVAITDVNGGSTLAGTITSISASNYTSLGISDNALTNLSLTGGSGNIIIDNSGLDTPTNLTLALTADGLTGGTLDDADIYTTLNVTTANRNSTLANLTTSAVTALTVAGTNRLTLTSSAGLTALHTVAVTGSAGLSANLTNGVVTSVDTSGTTGASSVTINGLLATFNGGAGADTVVVSNGSTKAISLGDGNDNLTLANFTPTAAISGGAGIDTLTMDASTAATASGSGAFATLVTGFERLALTGSTNQTVNLTTLGINSGVQTSGGNGLTLSNLVSGGTLTLTGAGTAYTISPSTTGSTQVLNLALTDGSGSAVSFAATGISAPNFQVINITTADTQVTPSGTFNDFVTLIGNVSQTVTVTGNSGLTLTANSFSLTTVDASGIALGGFTYTSGALNAAAVIKGSAAGTNNVDFSAATGIVTYTGGTGADAVTASNNKANVINAGDGNNSIVVGAGANTITTGAGNDFVAAGNGNNSISTGDGTDSVTVGTGTNVITMGVGAKSLTLGAGSSTVTLGAHSTVTADTVSVAATTTGSYVPTAIITGLNTAGADTITFTGDTATSFTSFTPAQLVTFGNALGNNVTAGSAPPTLAAAVADVLASLGGNLAQHGIGAFQYNGNTYLVEQHGSQGAAFAATDTLLELTGLQAFNTTSLTSGTLHLLT